MMAPIFLCLVAIFFTISPANVFGWEITLTGDNYYDASTGDIYHDEEQGILVFIKSCDRSERAVLKLSDEQIKIQLIEEECDVKSVYKSVSPISLKKKVNIFDFAL